MQSAKARPASDYGSDHQLRVANFRLKLKKVGKTTSLARYNLNQIPYECAVEVTNRFRGLDLVDKVPEKVQEEIHNTVQEAMTKTTPNENKCQEGKVVF